MKMDGLTEGRIVHYVLDSGSRQLEHRPAIVVKVWNKEQGSVNLQVFTDGQNDDLDNIIYPTSVLPDFDEYPQSGTWHWIEKA